MDHTHRKTAPVTGALGGIGYELAAFFARDGINLIVVARQEGKLSSLCSGKLLPAGRVA